MATIVALHWTDTALQYVVLKAGQCEAAASIAIEPDMDPAALGRRLHESLAPLSLGRSKTVVALGRDTLQWQHLTLPPCPADELSEVVRLQADRDLSSVDEDLGFDFLPLVGDEQTPYEVLTVEMTAADLAKIRELCQAAHLTLERAVPLAIGWPALAKQASTAAQGNVIYIVLQTSEATLWATQAGKIVLFRQFQLAETEELSVIQSALASEIRRTLLALSQHSDKSSTSVKLVENKHLLSAIRDALNTELDIEVNVLNLSEQHKALAACDQIGISTAPLVGIALDEHNGTRPLVDLLHPHRRPKQQVNLRTYSLAATAAVSLVALLGWLGYTKLQAPLDQAAIDQAEITLLNEPLDDLKEHEQRAKAIQDWRSESPNVLHHLLQLSKQFRPQPLRDEEFSLDQDVILKEFSLAKRQLTIDALARSSQAVQPLELRLREANYGPKRGKSSPSETVKDYNWQFKSTIDITAASDTAAKPPVEEEPQS